MFLGEPTHGRQRLLFLQGPISPFFARLADALEARGHRCLRVNLCLGDRLLWRRAGAIDYRGQRAGWPGFIAGLMKREGVTDLVLLGEQRPYHRDAIQAARDAGVRVTVTDYGYLRPDWITLEPDGMSALSHFPREPEAIAALAATAPEPDLTVQYGDSFRTQATLDVAYYLLSWLFWMLYPGYRSHQIHHPVLNYLATGWRLLMLPRRGAAAQRRIDELRVSGRPWWVFPMQMEVDYSIRAYSRFADMLEPLRVAINAFAANAPPDDVLAIKIHPLDPGLRNWPARIRRLAAAAGVADRVVFLDGGALDALLTGARGMVTVNSTVGLWALRAGVPTMTLGAAVYDVPGLTWQGTLDAFFHEPTPPDPALVAQFVRALADTIQIRGGYYVEPGLSAGVQSVAARLDANEQTELVQRLGAGASRQKLAKAPHAAIPTHRPDPKGSDRPDLVDVSDPLVSWIRA